MRLHRLAAPWILLAAVACGDDKPAGSPTKAGSTGPASPAVDRSSPEVVLVAAHRALSAGDLAALRPYLTDRGYSGISRDLVAWRSIAVDSRAAASGAHTAPRVRLPDDPAAREAAKAALASDDPGPLLRTLVAIEPRVPLPPLAPVARDASVGSAELSMPARDGETRLVRFVRTADGWRIDRLEL